MGSHRYIERARLQELLQDWARDHQVLVPIEDGDAVVFRPFDGGGTLRMDRQPTAPPKDVVFPQTETLLRVTQHKNPEDLTRTRVEVEEAIDAPKTIVFGSRPCGARGFAILDPVFDCERIRDPYYAARRTSTLFVSLVCTNPETTCFCNSVGGGPADATASDILLVPLEGGYLGEAISERGRDLLSRGPWTEAGERATEAARVKQQANAAMAPTFDVRGMAEQVLRVSEDAAFWDDVAAKCVGCGACTYLCPTCYCFDISDESAGLCSKRLRTWDTCMSCSYSLEASGHNPRARKSSRLANRVSHKFGYYPHLHQGVISCTGCGRCIKSCPVSVDIREIVIKAKELTHA